MESIVAKTRNARLLPLLLASLAVSADVSPVRAEVLGYDPGNVIGLRDATQAETSTWFDNRESRERRLWRYLHPRPGMFAHHLPEALYGGGDTVSGGRVMASEAKAYPDDTRTIAAWMGFGRHRNARLDGAALASVGPAGGAFPSPPTSTAPARLPPPGGGIGKEVREPGRRSDADAFARAEPLDTESGYREYLDLACGGRHESEARALLAEVSKPTSKVGDTFRDCAGCPRMVVVPAGSYMMGSPPSEEGWEDDECPVHEVTISHAFAVGVYEVTFGEWDACVSGGGCNGYRPDDGGWGRGSRPVVNVNWEDAKGYVGWLSRETGEEYRLLSESEWEYVARAGTTTPFHTGRTISTAQANYAGNHTYGSGLRGRYMEKTVKVGSFAANGFGLYDVHGNVREWVEDCWNRSYWGAPPDGRARESGVCDLRMIRGGSWFDAPWNLRSANRTGNLAGDRHNDTGFRVARTLD